MKTANSMNITKKICIQHYAPACMALAMLCACADSPKEKTVDELYEEAFVSQVGEYSEQCAWNQASNLSVTVNLRKAAHVKVYAPTPEPEGIKLKYWLVADLKKASGNTEIYFDAPSFIENVIVDIDGKKTLAKPYTTVYDSSASSLDVSDYNITDDVLPWILAVENDFDAEKKKQRSGDELDFDFNDMVIRLRSLTTDDATLLTFFPLACGDDQKLYLHLLEDDGVDLTIWPEDKNDNEYHLWFGVEDFDTYINTAMIGSYSAPSRASSITAVIAKMSGCTITLDKGWSLSSYSQIDTDYSGTFRGLKGIYVTVGTYKKFDEIKDNDAFRVIAANYGRAPHMLLFPDCGYEGRWFWPAEGESIVHTYSMFSEWMYYPHDPDYAHWFNICGAPAYVYHHKL